MYVFGVNHINIYMHTIAEDVFILYANSYLQTILSFKVFFHTVKELVFIWMKSWKELFQVSLIKKKKKQTPHFQLLLSFSSLDTDVFKRSTSLNVKTRLRKHMPTWMPRVGVADFSCKVKLSGSLSSVLVKTFFLFFSRVDFAFN